MTPVSGRSSSRSSRIDKVSTNAMTQATDRSGNQQTNNLYHSATNLDKPA